jgi:hypothetical protein
VTITKTASASFDLDREGPPQIFLGRTDQKGAPPVAITKGPERVRGKLYARRKDPVSSRSSATILCNYRVGLDGTGLTH